MVTLLRLYDRKKIIIFRLYFRTRYFMLYFSPFSLDEQWYLFFSSPEERRDDVDGQRPQTLQ